MVPGRLQPFLSDTALASCTASWDEEKLGRLQVYIDEADFFFSIAESPIRNSGATSLLDVGSGIGLFGMLVATLGIDVTCLDPMSSGFEEAQEMRSAVEEAWIVKSKRPIFRDETLASLPSTSGEFDFITCINVVEHVSGYRDFLLEVAQKIGPAGNAYIVFPNYSFPYEPHFSIPTLFSKALTGRVFEKVIQRNSRKLLNPKGLWDELSWPTQKGAASALQGIPSKVVFSRETLARYFSRLSDKRFLERKGRAFLVMGAIRPLLGAFFLAVPISLIPIVDLRLGPKI